MQTKSKIKNQKLKIQSLVSRIPHPASRKLRVGVIFGGRSAEHEVSLVSASSIIKALDKNKYEIIPIGITPEGKWLSSGETLRLLKERRPSGKDIEHILTPDPTQQSLVALDSSGVSSEKKMLDVIFPVLHGTYGEDGTIQGLFELSGIPYVGAGVLGSSAGMDKVVTKQLCEQAGIPVTPYLWFLKSNYSKKTVELVERKLGYPAFVKPANSGSSVGISKAHNRKELLEAMLLAGEYDRKILVEQGVENAREIEISVLGNDEPVASIPGEIISSNEFYDYDAKYVDGKSTAVIPAKLPASVKKKLADLAVQTFLAIDCAGMARVDFLVTKKTNRIYLNEINTIPGFTSISMYPKLWEASGIPYSELLDRLIDLAIERHQVKTNLKTTFQPKADWFKE